MSGVFKSYIQRNFVDAFKGLPKEVWFLSINQLINKSGMMVIPFMALYLTTDMGWSESRSGFAIMFFGLGSVDRFGQNFARSAPLFRGENSPPAANFGSPF